MTEMTYRSNFWIWAIIHTVSLATLVIFFNSVYTRTGDINGWSRDQTLLVLGIGTLITGLGSLTFFPFMYDFSRQVAKGEFDALLAKPINTLFLSAIRWVDFEDIIVVPNSLILICYALSRIRPSHLLPNFLVFTGLLVCSLLILFSVLALVQSLAFKAIKIDSAVNFYWSIVNITKYPAKAISSTSILVLSFTVPVAIISSVPAEALMGIFDFPWIISSIALTAILLRLSYRVFYSSLRHYSSASS